jgi:hypothetical protein
MPCSRRRCRFIKLPKNEIIVRPLEHPRVDLMRARSMIRAVAAAILLAACAPDPPRYFGPQLAWLPSAPDPNIINSPAFAVRAPPPGQPGYLETIRYIDNGVKYTDPHAEFFVSFDGALCFRGLVNRQQAEFENYQNYWCMPPTVVNNIDALENNVSYVNAVRLWCRHAAPQCARRFGHPNFLDGSGQVANSIWAQIVPYKEARDALQYLIYLMGGDATGPTSLRG